jgi:hypothetical protein
MERTSQVNELCIRILQGTKGKLNCVIIEEIQHQHADKSNQKYDEF